MTGMTENGPIERTPMSDPAQVVIIARHELMKYIRGRRLYGVLLIVIVLALLLYGFVLPGSYGGPFAGSREEFLHVEPYSYEGYPGYQSIGFLGGSSVVPGTIKITVNGSELPRSEWLYIGNGSVVLFKEDLSAPARVVQALYDFAISPDQLAGSFLDFLPVIVVICVTVAGADSLIGELQAKTAYLLFPNPVRREIIFLGKLLGSGVVGLVTIGSFYVAIAAFSYVALGSVATYLSLSFGFAVLFLLACLAFALAVSSVSRGTTGAVILTFLLLLAILPMLEEAGTAAGVKMWYLPTFAGDSALYALQLDYYPKDASGPGTASIFYPDLGLSAVVLTSYFLLLTAIGMIVFRRRDLSF